ncbi:N-methyl-L-tryptophan oxidase [Corynebacterium heidelbergense]|nr:N-methyl-L-tryptophan oxidase [Corynebacterium heidelbergense]WCZ37446.1 Monomeric sarcosine oxidase [Corynebacterium heidelbergense]
MSDVEGASPMDADVIVVGLGSMGSAAVDRLAARGVNVLGFEQFGPVHQLGSHHGGSRIVRLSYFEHPSYVPLLRRAFELWDDLQGYAESQGEERVIHYCGGLYAGSPDCATYAGSLLAAREHGLDVELLTADECNRRFPQFTLAKEEVALFEKKAGFVRPELTVGLQLRRAAAHGADLRFNQKVREVTDSGGPQGVAVTTEEGTFRAPKAIITAGAWAPKMFESAGIPQFAERQVMYWFTPTDAEGDPMALAETFASGPVYIHDTTDTAQIYGFPASDGPEGGAKVAFFRKGRPTDPDEVDRVVTEEEVAAMQQRLTSFAPALAAGALVDAKACMYTTTPDEHFVIGPHPSPNSPNTAIACGFSGHGFKFVPVVGEILADLALTGETAHDISLFDPLRFSEVRAAQKPAPELR